MRPFPCSMPNVERRRCSPGNSRCCPRGNSSLPSGGMKEAANGGGPSIAVIWKMMSGLPGRRAKVAGAMQGANDEVADGAYGVTQPVAAMDRVELGIRPRGGFRISLRHVLHDPAFGIDHCGSPVLPGGPFPQSVIAGVTRMHSRPLC